MASSATHQHCRLSRIPVTAGAAVLAIGLLITGCPLQHGQCECGPYAHFQYF